MITALAFVPLIHLDNALAELAVVLPVELMPVLKYFEDTYVGSLNHILPDGTVVRNRPLFALTMWSDRTLIRDSRTNNFAEAAHRRLQTEFGVKHPNLWRFVDGLKKVQHHRDMLLARFERGNSQTAKRKKYEDVDKRLFELVNNFDIHTVAGFLRGSARVCLQLHNGPVSSNHLRLSPLFRGRNSRTVDGAESNFVIK